MLSREKEKSKKRDLRFHKENAKKHSIRTFVKLKSRTLILYSVSLKKK